MSTTALPGFRDFYPQEFAERAYLFGVWRDVARRYGLTEYEGPPLEALELYTRKSGEEIVGQLYNFEDKGGRAVALRPEMTPTLARMVAARANALRKPVRWFSIPQLFRYERQQKGRLREHFQLNVDFVGEADVTADAELVACGIDVMRALRLTSADIVVRFSNRQWLNTVLASVGVAASQFADAYRVMDKLHRQPLEVSREKLEGAGIASQTAEALLDRVQLGTLVADGEGASSEAAAMQRQMERYLAYVSNLLGEDASNWMTLDLSIVRGLAYYTGIVFEIFDRKGEMRAICGGGRYDKLLAASGGPDLPALGFGMGDVVLSDLVRARGLMPPFATAVDVWVVAGGQEKADEQNLRDVMLLAGRYRQGGLAVEYPFRRQSLSRQLQVAASSNARFAAIVHQTSARDSQAAVTLRDLKTGEQLGPMSSDEAVDYVIGRTRTVHA
jgi:histidyl-tRNA synthetase